LSQRIYKTIELTGTSTTSIEEAVDNAVERAAKTIRHMRWFEIVETRGALQDNNVSEWQVTVKISFALEE
jgi:flavin-binding protein dodecin